MKKEKSQKVLLSGIASNGLQGATNDIKKQEG